MRAVVVSLDLSDNELGEHGLAPASSQGTYLLLLHFYSLHLAIIIWNISMATPLFLIRSFGPGGFCLCVCAM